MSKHNQLTATVRQPSFSEGMARVVDIANVLGGDYEYFRSKRNTHYMGFHVENDLVSSVDEALANDVVLISGDYHNTKSRMVQEYRKQLEVV